MGRIRLALRVVPVLIAASSVLALSLAVPPTPLGKATADIVARCGKAWKIALPPVPADPLDRDAAIDFLAVLRATVSKRAIVEPRPITFDKTRLPRDVKRGATVATLVRTGYIAPVGPLALRAPRARLTSAEWGDALAFALSRAAAGLHAPSRKFSPRIMD